MMLRRPPRIATSTGGRLTSPRLLTDDEVAHYHRDGYVPLGRVLDDADIADLLVDEARFRPSSGYGSTTLFVTQRLRCGSPAQNATAMPS